MSPFVFVLDRQGLSLPGASHDTSTFPPIELAFLPFVWYFLLSSNGSGQSDGAVREIYQVVIDGSAILKA